MVFQCRLRLGLGFVFYIIPQSRWANILESSRCLPSLCVDSMCELTIVFICIEQRLMRVECVLWSAGLIECAPLIRREAGAGSAHSGFIVNALLDVRLLEKSIGRPEIEWRPQRTATHWAGLDDWSTVPFPSPRATQSVLRPSWRCWAVCGRPVHYAGCSPVGWLSLALMCIVSDLDERGESARRVE